MIELVEQGLCNQKNAGKLCGFHRNTVFKILRTKRFLGIEAVLIDDRGHKEPYKYINEVRSYIKKLLRKYPDRKDQDIANQATKELDMEISRSAVARIRTEGHAKAEALCHKLNQVVDPNRFTTVSIPPCICPFSFFALTPNPIHLIFKQLKSESYQ